MFFIEITISIKNKTEVVPSYSKIIEFMKFTDKEAFDLKDVKIKIHGKGNNAAISCLDCNFPVLLAPFLKLGIKESNWTDSIGQTIKR